MQRRKECLDLRKQVIQGLFVCCVADDLSRRSFREQLGQKSVCCTAIPTSIVLQVMVTLVSHVSTEVCCYWLTASICSYVALYTYSIF